MKGAGLGFLNSHAFTVQGRVWGLELQAEGSGT